MSTNKNDVSRLESLSDGVFAFSATLLVVSLEVPSGFSDLVANLYGFIPFSLTFGALITLWTVHRAFFRRYPYADPWIVVLNSMLLFVILFYVYPLKFMTQTFVEFIGIIPGSVASTRFSEMGDLATLFALYSAGFAAIFLFVALMYRHAYRNGHKHDLPGRLKMESLWLYRQYMIFVFVAFISIGISVLKIGIVWGLPGSIYILLGPLCYWNGKWCEKKGILET